MKKRVFPQVAAVCFALVALSISSLAQDKARLLILPFDGRKILPEIQRACNCAPATQPELGNAVSDKLINRLVGGDTYTVVERAVLESLRREHELNLAGLIDDQTAVQYGKWAGAGVIVTGSITPIVKYRRVLNYYWSADVEVVLEARMVSVLSATVIASVSARSAKFSGQYQNGDGILNLVIKAVDDAVGKLAAALVEKGTSPAVKATIMKGAPPPPPGSKLTTCGKLALIEENTLTIKNNPQAAMKVGQTVRLRRRGQAIPDPDDPRKTLDYKYTEVGSISITEVGENTSTGVFTGNTEAKVGDEVFCPVLAAAVTYSPAQLPPRRPGTVARPASADEVNASLKALSEKIAAANATTSGVKSYAFSNLFTVDIPAHWMEMPGDNSKEKVWLGPLDALISGGGLSRGILAGVRRSRSKDLRAASIEYIAELIGNNKYLAPQGEFAETTLGGQRCLARTFFGMSPNTGKTESVTIHTAFAKDGRLLYFVTISPEETPQADPDVEKVVKSFRFK